MPPRHEDLVTVLKYEQICRLSRICQPLNGHVQHLSSSEWPQTWSPRIKSSFSLLLRLPDRDIKDGYLVSCPVNAGYTVQALALLKHWNMKREQSQSVCQLSADINSCESGNRHFSGSDLFVATTQICTCKCSNTEKCLSLLENPIIFHV